MNRMRDDQEFNVQFVKIVEKERTLYDKTLPEYRSKEEHEKVWMKISEQINESGEFFWFEYVQSMIFENYRFIVQENRVHSRIRSTCKHDLYHTNMNKAKQ